jgi:4-hydroxybenzoate polyprenyltransferase/phosphoserine phosphatase
LATSLASAGNRPGRVRDSQPPLCVDLDGTLILSDLLLESFALLIKRNPLYLFLVPLWLLRGKAALKAEISARVHLDPAALPYDREFLSWLQSEKNAGRSLWLCTAATHSLAAGIAAHLNLFEGVMASARNVNLAGKTKAARLVGHFGARGFDYCADARRDLAVWRHAHGAVLVHASPGLEREVARLTPVLRSFPLRVNTLKALSRALRPHQWAKNILIFVPLLTAHRLGDPAAVMNAILGVLAFCLCASSVYVVNDLMDLEADRAHPRKCMRPFAAGTLPLLAGFTMAPILLGAALLIALFLPANFLIALGTYYAATLAYSFALKGLLLVDAVVLAGLYTLRIVAGAAVIDVDLSFWLLLFSVFIFLSLAFVKRYTELDALRRQQGLRAAGRGYEVQDLPVLQSLGTAAGYLSILVLALYINSPDVEALYHRPSALWILCVLVLFWISRVWMKAQRGAMPDDPVVFALKDPVSIAIGLLSVLAVALAI